MAPRTVLAPVYNELCVVRPESAVMGPGGRARTPLGSSRGGAPSGRSTLSQAIVALASRRLSVSFPALAVRHTWTIYHERHAQAV